MNSNKKYELSNHLGNVLVTISDRKIPYDQNNDNIVMSNVFIKMKATVTPVIILTLS